MALRNILTEENPALRKVCRPYTAFDERLHQLLDDMKETLSQANGVGLAAPQVGIIRRACIVMETNVPEGEDEYFIELVNPEIIERDGEQEGGEGCLSLPESARSDSSAKSGVPIKTILILYRLRRRALPFPRLCTYASRGR